MDYSTYAQLSGFPYMPAPESYYPEMRGGGQQQEPQKHYDGFQQGSNQDYQASSVSDYYQYERQGQGRENQSEGFQTNSHNAGRQCTSSEYRCMAREQKRDKEMKSRNGLYSPLEASARYSGGDASYYPSYSDGGRRMEPQNGNPYW